MALKPKDAKELQESLVIPPGDLTLRMNLNPESLLDVLILVGYPIATLTSLHLSSVTPNIVLQNYTGSSAYASANRTGQTNIYDLFLSELQVSGPLGYEWFRFGRGFSRGQGFLNSNATQVKITKRLVPFNYHVELYPSTRLWFQQA